MKTFFHTNRKTKDAEQKQPKITFKQKEIYQTYY